MRSDHFSVIDSAGEKNKREPQCFCLRSERSSEDIDKERFGHHEDYRENPHGAVAAGMRLIYLLSNVPDESFYIIYLPAADERAGYKRWISHSIVGSMDLACRQKIYCRPSIATRRGSSWRYLYPRDDPPISLLFVTRIKHPVYKTDRKKCKLRKKYSRILRSEEEKSPPIFFRLLDPTRMKQKIT